MKKHNHIPCWTTKGLPYIIAEAGVNHNGQLDMAIQLVETAKKAGADAVKFQAFTADELILKNAPKAPYQKKNAPTGESQYDMLKKLELSEDDFLEVMECCKSNQIEFIVTPFSPRWVAFFAQTDISTFKIGSGNLGVPDLLEAIAKTKRSVIFSTGMSELSEVADTLEILQKAGDKDIAILHCKSIYPVAPDQVNLRAIQTLKNQFNVPVGFSDHTEKLEMGGFAVAAGATILEKHFTLDRKLPGPDHAMSLSPQELANYIRYARMAGSSMGNGQITPLTDELEIKKAARFSIVSTQPIKAGTVIKAHMLTVKRPGNGIPANQIDNVLNATAAKDIPADELVQPTDIHPA